MVKDDGKEWLLELTASINDQLKEDRRDIISLWEVVHKAKETHAMCREQIFEKIADLDKRLEITIVKTGLIISAIVVLGEYLLKHLLGN